MKKLNILSGATLGLVFVTAAWAGTAPNGADYCTNSANGCEHAAAAGAQCGSGAGSGGFGAFGKNNNFAGGANGPATGNANSAICGNKDGTKFD
jgi:hypothetical protein